MMLMEGSQQGTIENDENEIIQNVFNMNDTSAEEVSTAGATWSACTWRTT